MMYMNALQTRWLIDLSHKYARYCYLLDDIWTSKYTGCIVPDFPT